MNFDTQHHQHSCGIDLPAKARYVCILDQHGAKLVHKNLPTTPEAFLRLPRVQDFVSYCRLVKCVKESKGKRLGTSGKKIGNSPLRWACAEAAVLF